VTELFNNTPIMKECFIICPIGTKNGPIRKRSDQLLNYVLKPVLSKYDISPIRADKISKSGMITSQVINSILDSYLVIADLTGGNSNVFYELALRHAIKRPFIHIIDEGEKIPFDIQGIRTIQIDLNDLDSTSAAKDELDKQIEEINKGHLPDSPISIATLVKSIQTDSKGVEKLVGALEDIRGFGWNNLDTIADKIDDGVGEILNKLDDLID